MTVNLVFAHYSKLTLKANKIGIWAIHFGLILLLLGSGLTALFSVESQLRLPVNGSSNYTKSLREVELVVSEEINDTQDRIISFNQSQMFKFSQLEHPDLPFVIHVDEIYENSQLYFNSERSKATQGFGQDVYPELLAPETEDDKRNITSAYISLVKDNKKLGTWLLSNGFKYTQIISVEDRSFRLDIREKRYYTNYSITLDSFTHEKYPGTDIPHHFESKVSIKKDNESTVSKHRIYMNHPLRFEGLTFYQASYAENNTVSILQVVKNPGWLLPYISCLIMSIGLILHFGIKLYQYIKKVGNAR